MRRSALKRLRFVCERTQVAQLYAAVEAAGV
jgi:hypothetical protein